VREDALDEQRSLIDLIEREGWDVTETDLSVYESPWEETDAPEATVTITARKPFPEDDDATDESGGGDDSPYRVN
jgi:hypothetical protein